MERAGARCVAVRADTASEDDVDRLFDTVADQLGTVTGLVNNAGVTSPLGRLVDVRIEDLRQRGTAPSGAPEGLFGERAQWCLMLSQPSTSSGLRGPGPMYRADGRTSLFSCFCSMMCALQPAVRAHVNIEVNMCAGTSA